METRSGATELATLRRRWPEWTAVVERFARRRRMSRRVEVEGYLKLHRELLAVCRSLAGQADEARRAFYQRLADLVSPWLGPHVFERTDLEILFDLLDRCREVERELVGRTLRRLPRRLAWGALTAGAAACVLWLAVRAGGRWGDKVLAWLGEGWRELASAFKVSVEVPHVLIVGIIAIPVAMYVVWHSIRG
jgi:hypothetical protein